MGTRLTDRLRDPPRAGPARVVLLCLAVLGLSGCAETVLIANTAKQIRELNAPPPAKGRYKVGSPYQIKGVWYYPRVDYAYDESGVASWYGPNFHGKPTANGEVFDQNAITAAHRTLPLPSIVRVTNLENGRALVVRVNDRGPFAHGRIIDLSRRSAQLLGFERQGVARVRVRILAEESRAVAQLARTGVTARPVTLARPAPVPAPEAVPVKGVSVETLAPVPGTTAAPPRADPAPASAPTVVPGPSAVELARRGRTSSLGDQPVEPTRLFVQAASFSKATSARKLQSKLSDIGSADVYRALIDGRQFYRVRIGPMNDVVDADRVLEKVIARGFPGARIIVDRGG